MENKPMDDELEPIETLATTPPADLGKLIIAEALDRYDLGRRDKIYSEVMRLMACRDDARRLVALYTASAEWYRRKLEAIEKGEFRINDLTGALEFPDQELQRANY